MQQYRKFIIPALLIVLLICGAFAFIYHKPTPQVVEEKPIEVVAPVTREPVRQVIGLSVESRPIEAYTYGEGSTTLVFIGGMHGGYEWNSVLLAYRFIDELAAHPELVPKNERVIVIPDANPDGIFKVTGKVGRFVLADVKDVSKKPEGYGRFNAHDVDLNRNFDCHWEPKSAWRGHTVSAGAKAFSEPEAIALRDFLLSHKPESVVFWHSQANAVYASECDKGILPATLSIMNAYAKAAGYPAVKSFDAYKVTGDAEGWLASEGIPAVTVELKTHETVEWERNFLGIKALLELYRSK